MMCNPCIRPVTRLQPHLSGAAFLADELVIRECGLYLGQYDLLAVLVRLGYQVNGAWHAGMEIH